MRVLRLGLAQVDCAVGGLDENMFKVLDYIGRARGAGADIVVFPELCLTGYPPEDLLLKPRFVEENIKRLEVIAKSVKNIVAIVGFVDRTEDIYNAAAVLHNQKIVGVIHKMLLPYYGVFDENRYFMRGMKTNIFTIAGVRTGVSICEDIWHPDGPVVWQARDGMAELLINISASPYHHGKRAFRERMLAGRAQDNSAVVAYTNLVGGQDELVFDGSSAVFGHDGEIMARGKAFEEDLIFCDVDFDRINRYRVRSTRNRLIFPENAGRIEQYFVSDAPDPKPDVKNKKAGAEARIAAPLSPMEEVYRALVLGVKDYFGKNNFKKAVIGISGGIDSAICAAIACDALGKENVAGIFMPSQYTPGETRKDVEDLIENLQIPLYNIPINQLFDLYKEELNPLFAGTQENETEENIQARIRGNIMMAVSNKFGWIVLTTGNKSEMSVGYATLYGDMAGGFAVIKDVYKTMVYDLANYKNQSSGRDIIPDNIIRKAPSAELRPNQTDQDSLPPYDLLDSILKLYIEEDLTADEIIETGLDEKLVSRIALLVDRSEYKRRQAPVGIKITEKGFGKDRRFPISNRYMG